MRNIYRVRAITSTQYVYQFHVTGAVLFSLFLKLRLLLSWYPVIQKTFMKVVLQTAVVFSLFQ